MFNIKQLKNLILLSVLIIIIAILVYLLNFKDSGFSKSSQDWGSFGEYLNLFVTIANTIILGYLSLMVIDIQSKRDNFEAAYIEASEKPILIFKVDQQTRKWIVTNVGKGTAMNIVVGRNGHNDEWLDVRKCYSLAPGQHFDITWFPGAYRILGIYWDIFPEKIYTSICQGDETVFNTFKRTELNEDHWINKTRASAIRISKEKYS